MRDDTSLSVTQPSIAPSRYSLPSGCAIRGGAKRSNGFFKGPGKADAIGGARCDQDEA